MLSIAVCLQAHSSVQKAANIAGLGANLRLITTRQQGGGVIDGEGGGEGSYGLNAQELEAAMNDDRRKGLTPVFVSANVGSTNSCAVDPVRAIAEVCHRRYYSSSLLLLFFMVPVLVVTVVVAVVLIVCVGVGSFSLFDHRVLIWFCFVLILVDLSLILA